MTSLKVLSTTAIATALTAGIALADPKMDYATQPEPVSFSQSEIDMIESYVGQPIFFADGTILGTITMIETNGLNEPQFHVELVEEELLDADKLVISVARESLEFEEPGLKIQTSKEELLLNADRARERNVIYVDVNA